MITWLILFLASQLFNFFWEKFTSDPSAKDLKECGQNYESLHHFLLSLLLKGSHINLLLIM